METKTVASNPVDYHDNTINEQSPTDEHEDLSYKEMVLLQILTLGNTYKRKIGVIEESAKNKYTTLMKKDLIDCQFQVLALDITNLTVTICPLYLPLSLNNLFVVSIRHIRYLALPPIEPKEELPFVNKYRVEKHTTRCHNSYVKSKNFPVMPPDFFSKSDSYVIDMPNDDSTYYVTIPE